MKTRMYLIIVAAFLLSYCNSPEKGKYIIPKHLQGYWQFKVDNPGDWAGPLLGPNFVEHYYDISYVENVNSRGGDTVSFTIKLPSGTTTEFVMFDFDGDQASIYYTGWSNPERCTKSKDPVYLVNVKPTRLPDGLYQKWAEENATKLAYEFKKNGTVLFNDKKWDILRVGYLEDKEEYRLLVNSGKEYVFLYLHAVSSGMLNIVEGSSWNRRLLPMASDPSVYAFKGNWKDTSTGDWELGLFEDFVVYKSEFWDYKSYNVGKESNKIVIKKGSELLNINMSPISDSLASFTIGEGPSQTLKLCSKYLGEYPVKDNTLFKDNGYKIDTVTIIGYIRGAVKKDIYRISCSDWLKDESVEHLIQPDEYGRFTLKIPVLNSQIAFFGFPGKRGDNVLEPGEKYFYYYNTITQQELWMGDNVRFQNEHIFVELKREYVSYEDRKNMSPDELLDEWAKELMPINLEKLNAIEKIYPTLSDKFRYYYTQSVRYGAGFDLMQKRFDLSRTNEKFSNRYMDFVETELIANLVHPYTLISSFSTFIRDYTDYTQIKDRAVLNVEDLLLPIMEYIEENGILKLTPEEKLALKHYKVYSDSSIYLSYIKRDSIASLGLGRRYENKLKPLYILLENQRPIIEETAKGFSYIRFTKHVKGMHLPDDLKELLIARNYYKLMSYDKVPLKNNIYDLFKQEVHNTYLTKDISDFNDGLIMLETEEIKSLTSLKDNGPLESIAEGRELLNKIIEPYKGKVIYVDFWGTWCGPCEEQMKYVKDVKKKMENKDVVFLYFADNSPDQTWKNFIKKYDLTGDNVVHYNLPNNQQIILNAYMKVNSFPSYFIIDKEGEVVDMKAPRPIETETLVATLNEWLNK